MMYPGRKPARDFHADPEEVPDSMADSSFDIVSKVDRQEVDNALNQAARDWPPGSTSAAPTPPSPGRAMR